MENTIEFLKRMSKMVKTIMSQIRFIWFSFNKTVLEILALIAVTLLTTIFIYNEFLRPEELELHYWTRTRSRNISLYLNDNEPPRLIPANFCRNSFLLVMVQSRPNTINKRTAIRAGWGHPKVQAKWNMTVYFLLGVHDEPSIQYYIDKENETFQDILQVNFIDSYDNLTLKSVAMVKWFIKCDQFTYLMKIDDDNFLNVPLLMGMLKTEERSGVLFGMLQKHGPKLKNASSKWYSPDYMYSARNYPPCLLGGTGYVMSRDVAEKLYKAALVTEVFHMEDIFLTGLCAQKANITPRHHPSFNVSFNLPKNLCDIFQMTTIHGLHQCFFSRIFPLMEMLQPICVFLGKNVSAIGTE